MICQDCGPLPPKSHFQNWLDALLHYFLISIFSPFLGLVGFLSPRVRLFIEETPFLEKIFMITGLVSAEEKFTDGAISSRSTVFFEEARKQGIRFKFLKTKSGHLNHFLMFINDREFVFEGLPRAEFLSDPRIINFLDDKYFVKKILMKHELPVMPGRSFWWFEKSRAADYAKEIGYPLVVKPRWGSMSQHITLNIKNENELRAGFAKTIKYNPAFIVEEYLPQNHTYRATVIDFENVACCKRIPAHVVGDNKHAIQELVEIKNSDPRRGKPKQKNTTLYKLVVNETSHKLLNNQNLALLSVPAANRIVWLQEKVILDLGADLVEVTKKVHQANADLFRKVARLFDIRLVGIDFLAEDINKSWQDQRCAILELNSMPYIDMHHFPTEGEPVNVAQWITDMVLKYYR